MHFMASNAQPIGIGSWGIVLEPRGGSLRDALDIGSPKRLVGQADLVRQQIGFRLLQCDPDQLAGAACG